MPSRHARSQGRSAAVADTSKRTCPTRNTTRNTPSKTATRVRIDSAFDQGGSQDPPTSPDRKLLLQPLPMRVVVAFEQLRFERELRRPDRQLRFEEKHQRVIEVHRFQLRVAP